MATREYVRALDPRTRSRHYLETKRGAVIDFVVQLAVLSEGRWQPVIRYDMAHGIPHMDTYETTTRRSKAFLDMSAGEALTHAQIDVRDHWRRHRDLYFRRRSR